MYIIKFCRIILLTTIIFFVSPIYAQIIVAPNKPIASIVKYLVEDQAEVVAVSHEGCIDHFHPTTETLHALQNANLFIAIDPVADEYLNLVKNKDNILYLKDAPLEILTLSGRKNWHIWLGQDNIKNIILYLSKELPKRSGLDKDLISERANILITKVKALEGKYINKNSKHIFVIGHELEYLAKDFSKQYEIIDMPESGLKNSDFIKICAHAQKGYYFLVDHSIYPAIKKFLEQRNAHIINLNSEHVNVESNLQDYFLLYLESIYYNLSQAYHPKHTN